MTLAASTPRGGRGQGRSWGASSGGSSWCSFLTLTPKQTCGGRQESPGSQVAGARSAGRGRGPTAAPWGAGSCRAGPAGGGWRGRCRLRRSARGGCESRWHAGLPRSPGSHCPLHLTHCTAPATPRSATPLRPRAPRVPLRAAGSPRKNLRWGCLSVRHWLSGTRLTAHPGGGASRHSEPPRGPAGRREPSPRPHALLHGECHPPGEGLAGPPGGRATLPPRWWAQWKLDLGVWNPVGRGPGSDRGWSSVFG